MNGKLMQDHLGNTSSTRLMGALVILDIMLVWTVLSMSAGNILDLPPMVVGVFTVAASWLAVNKGIEVFGHAADKAPEVVVKP